VLERHRVTEQSLKDTFADSVESDGIEIFERRSPGKARDEIQSPQLVWAEVNVLSLPYAVLNEREARTSTGHHLQRIDVRNGKAVRWEWKVWPEPGIGMPTVLSLQVLCVISQIAAETKQRTGQIPQKLCIGSLSDICRRLNFPADGRHRALVKQHIRILVGTQCKSEGAFKNKEREGQFIGTFKYLRAAGFIGDDGSEGATIEENYVVFDDPVWVNLNAQYIKQIDVAFMRSLRSPIAQVLYTKLSHLFNDCRGDVVDVEYQWLAERMGIKLYSELHRARAQLKQAFLELQSTQYISSFEWIGAKIRIMPGVRYSLGEQLTRVARKKAITQRSGVARTREVGGSKTEVLQQVPIDPLLPICALYSSSGWKSVQQHALRKGLTQETLNVETSNRGLQLPTDS
jgi:hypothetical protein